MLDWTENVLIALWFATESYSDNDHGEIFALNTRNLCANTEFKYHLRNKPGVYGPTSFQVVLRSELAKTSYLDELLSSHPVRAAALSIGFPNNFWERLLKITAHIRSEDIELIENHHNIISPHIHINDIPDNFLNIKIAIPDLIKLYKLMPIWLQKHCRGSNNQEKAKEWLFNFIFSLRKPVAVFPERRNIRITAQSGMFVLTGGNYLPKKLIRNDCGCRNPKPISLDFWNQSKILLSAKIPKKYKENIRNELEIAGFNQASIFPDLDKQAQYIKDFWKVDLK